MKKLRAILRLGAIVCSSLLLELLWVLGVLPARLFGGREAWRRRIFRAWGRSTAALAGMRIHVRGRAPDPPFLLVSNHLSYLDIVLFASLTGAAFVSKAAVGRWPVLGPLSKTMGTLFVERGRRRDVVRVGELISARMTRGQGILLFPEGTSFAGERVRPFLSSLLEPAARAEVAVHWAVIGYRTPAGEAGAGSAVCWWGDMQLAGHLMTLLGMRGFEAFVEFGAAPILDSDRKSLAQRLETEVVSRFRPLSELELGKGEA